MTPGAPMPRRSGVGFNFGNYASAPAPLQRPDPEVRKCRPCRGKGVDRHGFDCVTCLGSGEVDE